VSPSRRLRVGFDARWHSDRSGNVTGVGFYVRSLVRALANHAADFDVELIAYGERSDDQLQLIAGGLRTAELRASRYSLREQFVFPFAAGRDKLDVLHVPFFVVPVVLPCPLVSTIHDIEMLVMPESGRSRFVTALLLRMYKAAIYRSSVVVTDSEHSRSELIKTLGAPPSKVQVVYPGVRSPFDKARISTLNPWDTAQIQSAGSFFLAMAHRQVKIKNTSRVLAAHRLYRERGGTAQLVFFGDDRWCREQLPEAIDDERAGSVLFVGRIPDNVLIDLYARCEALVYPSLTEGFGLPVVECMASGGLVITSDRGSLPEISGGAALIVDPLNVGMLAQAMLDVSKIAPKARAELVDRGRARAEAFSYDTTARSLLAIYRSTAMTNPI
jgi:glycosyltransferase involved in cell wall biosynthesis